MSCYIDWSHDGPVQMLAKSLDGPDAWRPPILRRSFVWSSRPPVFGKVPRNRCSELLSNRLGRVTVTWQPFEQHTTTIHLLRFSEEASMLELHDQIQDVVSAIRQQWDQTPHAGIILGTGLGSLVEKIEVEASIEYGDLPHFPQSTAISHRGRLVCGKLNGLPVMAMEGRFHMYEGYPLKQITLPVRVMQAMGAELLVVSNACGGMNPYFKCGDIMVIDDHINLMGDNPLIGINDDRLGPRFPDMCEPYTRELVERALTVARKEDISAHQGVFVAVAGPNLETRAEYRFLRTIGADVVGMSTVPEVIVAVHAGMRVVGFSIITDMCLPDALKPANVEEIIAVANEAEPKLTKLVLGVLAEEKK